VRKIALSQGKFAMVDDEDYTELLKYTWAALRSERFPPPDVFYARGTVVLSTGEKKKVLMHRLILGIAEEDPKTVLGHHVDGDGLNNQRSNLEIRDSRGNAKDLRRTKGKRSRRIVWKD